MQDASSFAKKYNAAVNSYNRIKRQRSTLTTDKDNHRFKNFIEARMEITECPQNKMDF